MLHCPANQTVKQLTTRNTRPPGAVSFCWFRIVSHGPVCAVPPPTGVPP
jgi:hypothetical protein